MKPFFLIVVFSLFLAPGMTAYGKPGGITPGSGVGLITGCVTDAVGKVPLEYANVVLFRLADSGMLTGTVTDPVGKFTLKNIPFGDYYMVVNFIGYRRKVVSPVCIDRENRTRILDDLVLEPAAENLSAVEISGERPAVEYKIDKKVVNVAKNPNAAGGTAVDALRNVPSVQVDVEGNVTVRGSSNFTVLVNGRPTALNGNDLLKQTPAGSIENIEVITNPSAKYDPDGTAGIINLIMKKQQQDGFSGLINASAGTGEKYSADANFNQRIGKWALTAGGDLNTRMFRADQDIRRTNLFPDSVQYLFSNTERGMKNSGRSLRCGLEYVPDPQDAFTFSGETGYFGYERSFPNYNHRWSEPMTDEVYYFNDNRFLIDGLYSSGNFHYQHTFRRPGHELSMNLFRSAWDGDRREFRRYAETGPDFGVTGVEYGRETASNLVQRNTWRVKADYTLPLGDKQKIEAGIQGDRQQADFDYRVEHYDYDQEVWTTDEQFTNQFGYTQAVWSGYATFSGRFKWFDYQLGLRYERMERSIHQKTVGKKYLLSFESLFPTLHLTRQFEHGHQLQLSFSRRIDRPQEWMLNPFPMYSDGTFSSYGNPELEPEYTNVAELNYMKMFKKSSVSAELFCRSMENSISQAFRMNEAGVLVSTFENMGRARDLGTELNANLNLGRMFGLNLVGSFFNQWQAGNAELQTKDQSFNAYSVQVIPRVVFPTGTVLQFVGMYFGPMHFPQGMQERIVRLDMTVRQEFLKKKLTLTVRGNDIFDLSANKYHVYGPNFDVRQTIDMESNVLTLVLSYKINNYTRVARKGDAVEMDSGGM